MFDQYSLMHGISGAVLGAKNVDWKIVLLLSIGFEIVEDDLKRAAPGLFPLATIESTQNRVGDLISVLAGWYVGKNLK